MEAFKGKITIEVNGVLSEVEIFPDDYVVADLVVAHRNGKNSAEAMAWLAEFGSKLSSPAQIPKGYKIQRDRYIGDYISEKKVPADESKLAEYKRLQESVRTLSLSVREQMKDRGGYRVRPGDEEYLGKITVGLGDLNDRVLFPQEFDGFIVVILPLDQVV